MTAGVPIPLHVGSGDAQTLYTASTAQRLTVRKGTSAAPDTTVNPLVKVERITEITEAAVVGDGGEAMAGILSINKGTSLCEIQVVGIYGAGVNQSPASAQGANAGGNDALGVYGVGRIVGSGTGTGIGGALNGRRDNSVGKASGAEITVSQFTSADDAYSPLAGYQHSQALWINAKGDYTAACGITFGNTDGTSQFDVGIGFTSQVAGGHTGGILNSSIRDDSTSVTSLDIRGTHTDGVKVAGTHTSNSINEAATSPVGLLIQGSHSTGAIFVTATAGHVGFGVGPAAGAMLFVQTDDAANSVAILKGKSGQTATMLTIQSSTATTLFAVGATGNVTRGEGCNTVLGTGTGTKIGTSTSQKLAFYNSTPIIQPSGTAAIATDPTTTMALANSLRASLVSLGLVA